MPDGVLICDGDGRIVYANRRLEAMTGYRRRQLIGRELEMLVPRGLRGVHREHRIEYARRPRARPMGSVEQDFAMCRSDGEQLLVDIALGTVKRAGHDLFIAVIRDLTARKRLEAQLAHQALHDPLTGLANRTLFFDRLRQAMALARRERSQVALVLLDLDQFKRVNDLYGHQTGDELLHKVALKLGSDVRATDTVARIGGDEFAWVLPRVGGHQAASTMMTKLLAAVPDRITVRGKRIEVGVSAGLALFPDDGLDTDALIRVADIRLYASKRRSGWPKP
jgi:diguanylate cyclase (GGDEF)-like protein/PAS domain S-box-containing protein